MSALPQFPEQSPLPEPSNEYQLSGWWRRAGALILDSIIVGIPTVIISAALGSHSEAVQIILSLVIGWGYYFYFLTRQGENNGQSPGKQALGIKIIRNDGLLVNTQTVLMREVLLKSILGSVTLGLYSLVDYLWPLPDSENRAIHDHGAKTHVVLVPKMYAPGDHTYKTGV